MPNHVHLILVPSDPDGLRSALARVHRRYAGHVHAREKRMGHFWQGRYGAVAMDEDHLASALRYVALNPVRAKLVERVEDWRWASTRAQSPGHSDGVMAITPIHERFPNFAELLETNPLGNAFDDAACLRIRQAETTGRPVGSGAFMDRIAAVTGRLITPAKRGPKPRTSE